MERIVLFTTNCAKCIVLKRKLDMKGIEYDTIEDIEKMKELGIQSVPVLKINDELLFFEKAIKWVNEQEEKI